MIQMIIIRFKSGFELPITCEKFTFSMSDITGEITNYNIEGIEGDKPLFFRSEDIECIWKKMDTLKMPYEWIPCSEKLPSDSDYYLVTDTYGDVSVIWFAHEKDYYGKSEWRETEDEILAWMPLPPAYKGDE